MLTTTSFPLGGNVNGVAQYPVLNDPRGAVLFVNSSIGRDTRSRLTFIGSAATVTAGSTKGPNGSSTSPLATVFGTNGALSYCTASRGDIIIVSAGHTENLSTSGSYSIPVGTTIICLGYGSSQATFTFTGGASTIITMGAGSSINGGNYDLSGVASVAQGFSMGAGSQLLNPFITMSSVTNQATSAVGLNGADISIINPTIISNTAGAANAIISLAANARLRLLGGRIVGNFSVAPLVSAAALHWTDILIDGIELFQKNGTAKNVISFTTSTTGLVRNCSFIGTTWASAADAIAGGTSVQLRWLQNFGFDDGAGAVSGVLVPAVGTIA